MAAANKGKKNAISNFQTPQASKNLKKRANKSCYSEPEPKRKKLVEEIDDELSEDEFDKELAKTRQLTGKQKQSLQKELYADEDSDEDDDDDDDEEDEDLDDSDDDDDEDEEDEDVDDDDEESEDDDDDDEDEDEEDEDDDSEEDAEAVKTSAPKASNKTSNNKLAAPSTVTLAASSKPVKANSKKSSTTPSANQTHQMNQVSQDLQEIVNRDKRTLFVKDLPFNVKEQELYALSKDIIHVRLQRSYSKKMKNKRYAFVEFKDEQTAEKNFLLLKGKQVGGATIGLDYVGSKSTFKPRQPSVPVDPDPLKLYVSGFSRDNVTEASLMKIFPAASQIDVPRKKDSEESLGFAFVHFTKKDLCQAAHDSTQGQVLDGKPLIVMYGKRRVEKQNNASNKKQATSATKTQKANETKKVKKTNDLNKGKVKKPKLEIEEESDDDDDDEEEDMEDEEFEDDDDDEEDADDDDEEDDDE